MYYVLYRLFLKSQSQWKLSREYELLETIEKFLGIYSQLVINVWLVYIIYVNRLYNKICLPTLGPLVIQIVVFPVVVSTYSS